MELIQVEHISKWTKGLYNPLLPKNNKKDPNRFYVYLYLDLRKPGEFVYGKYIFSYEPFYVGKGTGGRAFNFTRGHSRFVKNKLYKIEKPLVIILEKNMTSEKALLLEKEIIALIGRKNINKGPLCNFTSGGEEGNTNHTWKWSKKKKEIFREKRKKLKEENPFFGKLSEEGRERIREGKRGPQSEETKNKRKETLAKRKKSKRLSNRLSRKMSLAQTGVKRRCLKPRPPMTEETKRKMSETRKLNIAKQKVKKGLFKRCILTNIGLNS